ncbi:MAG: glycoside hydrolase family 5 protein [Polyangia bacterium]
MPLLRALRLPVLALALQLAGCSDSATSGNPPPGDGSLTSNGDGGTVGAAPGYLHTQGSQIVDSRGTPVRLTGVSWFGMETDWFAPHGLDKRSLASMLDQIRSSGFNSIRVPFCAEMLNAGSTPKYIDYGKNPDLMNKKPLEILDRIVEEAGKRGLRIVLDRHRLNAYGQSNLWYDGTYPEQRFLDDWKQLATRYKSNPTVIGFDLHNEPHGEATWGSGNLSNDWRLAAERAGNAVLAINPDLLIIVEGIEQVSGKYYWWGGNLMAAQGAPVRLSVADRLVYSIHDYPESVYGQQWFYAANYPDNLPGVWDSYWGYLPKMNTAPLWIGEFGTKLATDKDRKWMGKLVEYIGQNKLSFAFWSWNPDSGDTGGILMDDWNTVNQDKLSAIKPALAPPL